MKTIPGYGRITLSRDLPCLRCGHAAHTYLPCSDRCACEPGGMPGDPLPVRRGHRVAATTA
jgi:hypothetical protein